MKQADKKHCVQDRSSGEAVVWVSLDHLRHPSSLWAVGSFCWLLVLFMCFRALALCSGAKILMIGLAFMGQLAGIACFGLRLQGL